MRSLEERFWEKVFKKSGEDACWEWTAGRTLQGYGRLALNSSSYKFAHRLSWEIHNGPIHTGLCVCHSCDNPSCVNPAHLWVGTMADNMHDRDKKGRNNKGRSIKPNNVKLRESQVLAIRHIYEQKLTNQEHLGSLYGVHPTTISDIVLRKTWKHI